MFGRSIFVPFLHSPCVGGHWPVHWPISSHRTYIPISSNTKLACLRHLTVRWNINGCHSFLGAAVCCCTCCLLAWTITFLLPTGLVRHWSHYYEGRTYIYLHNYPMASWHKRTHTVKLVTGVSIHNRIVHWLCACMRHSESPRKLVTLQNVNLLHILSCGALLFFLLLLHLRCLIFLLLLFFFSIWDASFSSSSSSPSSSSMPARVTIPFIYIHDDFEEHKIPKKKKNLWEMMAFFLIFIHQSCHIATLSIYISFLNCLCIIL